MMGQEKAEEALLELLKKRARVSDRVFHTIKKNIEELNGLLNESGVAEERVVKNLLLILEGFKNSKRSEVVLVEKMADKDLKKKILASIERQISNIKQLEQDLGLVKKNLTKELIVRINQLPKDIDTDLEMVKRLLR